MCLAYIYIYQGANVGVATPRKSWNTMVNEENEKCEGVEKR